jgi:uncharacterized membrane protein
VTEPLPPVVGYIVGILTAIAGLVVGLGMLGTEEAHIIVTSIGGILGAGIAVVNAVAHALHRKAIATERAADPNAPAPAIPRR